MDFLKQDKCTGCMSCYNICTKKCITIETDGEGFYIPVINKKTCVNCGACQRVCPVYSQKSPINKEMNVAYACYSLDEKLRMESSSGGVFGSLARKVISSGGIVFGAGFTSELKVEHFLAHNIQEINNIQKSKYVQSYIGDAYKKATDELKNGKTVMFVGTPCQIAGYVSFLGGNLLKYRDKLLLVDFICHGVPSPKIWSTYLKYLEDKYRSKPVSVSFREKKSHGWKKFSMYVEFKNKKHYVKNQFEDEYLRAFLSDCCLRESCYHCDFKTKDRFSDLTLADFWGIRELIPEFDDDCGVSLVLINSIKGQKAFDTIVLDLNSKQVDKQEALQHNKNIYKSVKRPNSRDRFMINCSSKNFRKETDIATHSSGVLKYLKKFKRTLDELIKRR